jgi:serine/threonine-protein kinase
MGPNPIAIAMQHVHDAPPDLPADIPEPVRILVETALAKEPDQRFSSAASMADAADAARRVLSGVSDSTATLAAAVAATRLSTATALGADPVLPAGDPVFAPGVADGRPVTPGMAPAADRRALAAGSATVPLTRPATSPGGTSVMPAVLPPSSAPGGTSPPNRRRLLLILAGVLIVLLAVLGVLVYANAGDDNHNSPGPVVSVPPSAGPSVTSRPAAPQGTGTRTHRTTSTTGAPATTATQGNGGNPTTGSPTPSHTPTTGATTTTGNPTGDPTTTAADPPTGAGAARIPAN